MEYKLHRIAPNSEGWVRPSRGRLSQKGVGSFVHEHGFGHEDWNFNIDFAIDGQVLGYTVALPAKKYEGQRFGLVLATFDAGGWRAAGYYDGAILLDKPAAPSASAVEQMAVDVFELAKINQVAHRYMNQTLTQIENSIRSDFVYFRWAVPKDRIVVFRESLPIPPNIFEPGRQRMVTSYNLSEEQFRAITKLGADASGREGERSEEEGARRLRLHWAIERKPQLVAAFKASLTSFACTVCGFDFERTYKERGIGFIECHHTKPVAEIRPGEKTRLSDLRAVCSNCHQMLHRKPMLTVEELRDVVEGK